MTTRARRAMKLLGLTGGIGTGKSTAAGLLAARGVPVIDTDDIAREIVAPGQPALAAITAAFGKELLDGEGQLRRAALAELVFSSPPKRQQLESILHPLIRDRWQAQAQAWRNEGQGMGVVVIPLLFETHMTHLVDQIWVIYTSPDRQIQHLITRDHHVIVCSPHPMARLKPGFRGSKPFSRANDGLGSCRIDWNLTD